jgi:RNA polymerase sigma-70 factor (ECF subfamily)
VLLKAWRAIDTFNPENAAERWLGAVASRATIDLWRRGAKGREVALSKLEHNDSASDCFDIPDNSLNDPAQIFFSAQISREKVEATQAAVAKLPPLVRAVLDLRLQEMPIESIAETLVLPEGTVKTRLHRARQLVRQALEGEPEASLL